MDSEADIKIQFATKTTEEELQNRKTNICEDFNIPQGTVIILCKGHHGNNNVGAEIATERATGSIKRYFSGNIKNPIKAIQGALMLANFTVYDYAMKNEEFQGISVELLLVLILNDLIYYASAGNNQLLLQRENVLYQLVKPVNKESATFIGKEKNSRFMLSKNPVQAAIHDVLFFSTDGIDSSFSDIQVAELLSQDDLSLDLLCYQIIYKIEEQKINNNVTIGICRLSDKDYNIENLNTNNVNTELSSTNTSTLNINDNSTLLEKQSKFKKNKFSKINTKTILFIIIFILGITLIIINLLINNENVIDNDLKQTSTNIAEDTNNRHLEQEQTTPTITETKKDENIIQDPAKYHLYDYTVKKGDNLYRLVQRFGVSKSEIIHINNMKSEKLHIDQKIKIPITTIHTVKSGETLSVIAQKYKISVEDIKRVNQFDENSKLMADKNIIIPFKK